MDTGAGRILQTRCRMIIYPRTKEPGFTGFKRLKRKNRKFLKELRFFGISGSHNTIDKLLYKLFILTIFIIIFKSPIDLYHKQVINPLGAYESFIRLFGYS